MSGGTGHPRGTLRLGRICGSHACLPVRPRVVYRACISVYVFVAVDRTLAPAPGAEVRPRRVYACTCLQAKICLCSCVCAVLVCARALACVQRCASFHARLRAELPSLSFFPPPSLLLVFRFFNPPPSHPSTR